MKFLTRIIFKDIYLVTHLLNHFRARADESYSSIDHRLREIRSLRQETVTGMNSVHVILFRDFDDFRDIQVCLDRWQPSAHHVTLVGFLSVHLHLVLFRINGHGPDSQFRACSKHTDRDFSCENDKMKNLSRWIENEEEKKLYVKEKIKLKTRLYHVYLYSFLKYIFIFSK